MIEANLLLLLIVGISVGAAAGYLGSFMVLKHMSLVGDALSHVALPGMAIAIIFHISPLVGAFLALMAAVLGIWYFEKTSTIYPEALVGIFFTASLAIGILITPQPDLLEALFGNIENIQIAGAITTLLISLAVIASTFYISKQLILGIISQELTESMQISVSKINLVYFLLVGTVVALGVSFVGTLLTGALVVIPAASAKNVSNSLNSYYRLSLMFGALSAVSGVVLSALINLPPGPMVVLSGIVIFTATYIIRKVK